MEGCLSASKRILVSKECRLSVTRWESLATSAKPAKNQNLECTTSEAVGSNGQRWFSLTKAFGSVTRSHYSDPVSLVHFAAIWQSLDKPGP